MKVRLPAIALFVGLTIATVPMRSLATIEVVTQANEDLITEFIIQLDQPISRAEATALVQQLVDSDKVASAEINEKRYVATSPNDPGFSQQWYLRDFATADKGIGIESAWTHTTGSPTLVIAVIDTGYTLHPDLPTPLVGYDFFDNDADATDPGDASTVLLVQPTVLLGMEQKSQA